jgi:hypothetical protein
MNHKCKIALNRGISQIILIFNDLYNFFNDFLQKKIPSKSKRIMKYQIDLKGIKKE